ncbi:MAG: hypothetical protein QG635_926 [Bacteroidota bacterium]|nr:hypothetical protein [Bacteroidota bacterium]
MILKIINYTVRGATIIIGIILLTGLFMPDTPDMVMYRTMGVVFILFGIYRLIVYHSQQKRHYYDNED